MVFVQTAGFDLLVEDDRDSFEKLFNHQLEKLQRKVKDVSSFSFHIKGHQTDGSRSKFSLHSKVEVDGKKFEADSFDWDYKAALHKLFDKLGNEIEHTLHLKGHKK